jgi:hypothetical protein
MKTMYRFSLLICLVFTFYSCDNEPLEGFDLSVPNSPTTPDNPQTGNATIAGTWKLTAWNSVNPVDINNDGTASTNLLTEFDCYNNETIVFNSDGTGDIVSTSFVDIELNLVTGTTNTYEYSSTCIPDNETLAMTWVNIGNAVAVDDGSGAVNLALSGNELSFIVPSGFFVESDDAMVTVDEDLTFVYTKQ